MVRYCVWIQDNNRKWRPQWFEHQANARISYELALGAVGLGEAMSAVFTGVYKTSRAEGLTSFQIDE